MTPHEHLMDAIACNAEQQRLLYNPTAEIDSALEHALAAVSLLPPGPARDHVAATAKLLAHVQTSNRAEGDRVRTAAGQVNGRTARDPYAVKTLASTLRPHLANLANPLVTGKTREHALAAVANVLRECPAERVGTHERPNVTLRHELGRGPAGVRKYDALLSVVDGMRVPR